MGKTEFLSTLRPEEDCPEQANRLAAYFMRAKGFPDQKPFGVFIDGAMLYYYYRLPEGILEVEFSKEGKRWHKGDTDFITNESEIREMLGDETDEPGEPMKPAPQSSPVPTVTFKPPTV